MQHIGTDTGECVVYMSRPWLQWFWWRDSVEI